MQKRRRPILIAVTVLLVLGVITWRVSIWFLRSNLEIGPETTFVTGPLTSKGDIDYAAALHQRLSQGVKPEDNAAILIDQAFGPGAIFRVDGNGPFARTGRLYSVTKFVHEKETRNPERTTGNG